MPMLEDDLAYPSPPAVVTDADSRFREPMVDVPWKP